jgi:glycosyltransferase involved in cell wall biosynthesis
MKVTVIIPAYNEEKYIRSCLEHVTQQVDKADEIIVVNNNSTDSTVEIVKQFPVKVINETEQGMIPARNRGFNEAKGDIFVKTDADTQVPSDWVKRIKEDYKNQQIEALTGPVSFYDLPASSTVFSNFLSKTLKLLFHQNFLFGPNYSISKKMWKQIKGEVCLDDSKVHEDFDVSIHIPDPHLIGFDPNLIVPISARRLKQHPESFFGEYLVRAIRMMADHKLTHLKDSIQLAKNLTKLIKE